MLKQLARIEVRIGHGCENYLHEDEATEISSVCKTLWENESRPRHAYPANRCTMVFMGNSLASFLGTKRGDASILFAIQPEELGKSLSNDS